MIDPNRIRSMETLVNIQRDLTEFITNPVIRTLYDETPDLLTKDYDAEKDSATELLEKVNKRIESLSKFNAREAKQDSPHCTMSEQAKTPSAE